MTLYMESVADQTDHFAHAFVCENVVYGYDGYDVMTTFVTFKSLKPTPFLLEKSSVRK